MSIELEDDGLSEYERRFVEAYMGDACCNGAEAVMMITGTENAHSAAVTASRLLKRSHVRMAMRARVESDPLIPGRIRRMRLLGDIALGNTKEERVFMTKDGVERVKVGPTHDQRMAAIAALEKAAGLEHGDLDENTEDDIKKQPFQKLFDILTGKTGDK